MTIRFLRIKDVMARLGKGRSAIYADVKDGTLPPPIKIGERASAWLDSEITHIQSARIAGSNAETIRILVANLVEARVQVEGGVR